MAVGAVQDEIFPAAVVDAQGAVIGAQNPFDAGRAVLLAVGGGLQVRPEIRVPKGLGHLGVKILNIIIYH